LLPHTEEEKITSTVGWGEERTPTTSFSLAIAAFIVAADSTAPIVVHHPRLDIPVDAKEKGDVKKKGTYLFF